MDQAALLSQEKFFVVSALPLFADLPIRDRRLVARSAILIEYKKDDIIYREGDGPDALYCVVSGRLSIFKKGAEEAEELERIVRGKYFGVISLLTGELHSVSVQALTDSIILKIPMVAFNKMLKRIPSLALDLGRTLSRRLKGKDSGKKKIFESAIIAVYKTGPAHEMAVFALNLAVSLKSETGKRIIIVKIRDTGITLDSPFFEAGSVNSTIFKHSLGIDSVDISHRPGRTTHIIPFLSYLTEEYHYVIVDLPPHIDKITLRSLEQSDMIHIITTSDTKGLRLAGKLISELKKTSAGIFKKIRVITTEEGSSGQIGFEKKGAMLKHPVFATLPLIDRLRHRLERMATPIVTTYPDVEYSKAIRRISREIGECRIGLALGAGAALGLAHIGILKIIEKKRIPVDMVAGTSIGALIGALWASGKSADQIAQFVFRFKKKIQALRLLDITFPRKGLIRGGGIRKFLETQFKNKDFYNLKRPLKIICCDIETREEVVLDTGNIVDAIMASIAIPGIFEPVKIAGRLLVDGGIINPLPADVLTRLGISRIIAVNTLPSPEDIRKSRKKVSNIFDIIVNSIQASEYMLAEINCQNADIAMHPIMPTVDWYEIYKGASLIKRGEEEAMKYLPELEALTRV